MISLILTSLTCALTFLQLVLLLKNHFITPKSQNRPEGEEKQHVPEKE